MSVSRAGVGIVKPCFHKPELVRLLATINVNIH